MFSQQLFVHNGNFHHVKEKILGKRWIIVQDNASNSGKSFESVETLSINTNRLRKCVPSRFQRC
jgi:hypothetical protein